jgi:hypothetical protein
LVGYNALIEWIPAILLSLSFNGYQPRILLTVGLSYLAFICIYEIGYITNDQISEKFEDEPRGRVVREASTAAIFGLIAVRIAVFGLCTAVLGAWTNPVWLTFHGTLAISFLLHNILPNDMRIATFFSLSTYRFFAPIVLTVDTQILILLIPVILLNNSVYRLSVYLGNKGAGKRQSLGSKFGFYIACLPLGLFFTILYGSFLPLVVTAYFLSVWLMYYAFSKATGIDIRD